MRGPVLEPDVTIAVGVETESERRWHAEHAESDLELEALEDPWRVDRDDRLEHELELLKRPDAAAWCSAAGCD